MQKMKIDDLISALSQLSVETGSLACLGCGHEHNCSTSGCAIIGRRLRRCGMRRGSASRTDCPRIVAMSSLWLFGMSGGVFIWAGVLQRERNGVSMLGLATGTMLPSPTGCRCRSHRR